MSTHRPDASELLRWWHQHQAKKLGQTAEHIRNGLLQELFAIRRQLEVSCQTEKNAAAFGCDRHLENLETLYKQLENVSHDLNSPFLDSLPLALQHAIQPWSEQLPLTTEFASDWSPEPAENVDLLITFAKSFFQQLAVTTPAPQQCGLKLAQQATAKELTCYATGDSAWYAHHSSVRTNASIQTLLPFLETFRLLTQGEYHQISQPQQIGWTLRWQSPCPSPSIIPQQHHHA